MTNAYPCPLRAVLFAGALLGGPLSMQAVAQGYSSLCVETVANFCDGRPVSECFQYSGYWQALPEECLGEVESMIGDENDFYSGGGYSDGMADGNYDPDTGGYSDGMADGNYDPDVQNGQGYLIDAFSWGGNLRDGPSGQNRSIAVLPEGVPLQVLSVTDSWFQGYPWFYVNAQGYGEGFQWGGIICTRGPWTDGISGYC